MEETGVRSPRIKEMIGKIEETFVEVEYEWQIPQFPILLAKNRDKYYRSPDFHCSGGTWYLEIWPKCKDPEDRIGLFIKRGDSGSSLIMAYTLCLKISDNKRMESSRGTMMFEKGSGFGYNFPTSHLKEMDSDVLTAVVSMKRLRPRIIQRTSELSESLKRLMLTGDKSDVTVRVQGEEFRLHRLILGQRAPELDTILDNQMAETTSGIVDFDDCDADVFRMLVEYAYTGKVENLSRKNACRLREAARKYGIYELSSDCVDCVTLSLSVDTFDDTIRLALRINDGEYLLDEATRFFCDNVKDIIQTEKWETFMAEEPEVANRLFMEVLDSC